MSGQIRFKSLNEDTYTEMRLENGEAVMYVYDRTGNLLDVLEEIASYIPPKPEAQAKYKSTPAGV